jgi:diguanylate cyclase (GGDEF)-like protein
MPLMLRRPTKLIRLDQAVSRVLIRLGGLAALAVVAAVVVNLWRSDLYASADADISANQALAQAHAGMLDQETGLRGFLVAGQASFLEPYNVGLHELSQGDATLQSYITGDTGFLDDYVALRLAQDIWQKQWAALALAPQPAEARPNFLNEGKALFDKYRLAENRLNDNLLGRINDIERFAQGVATGGLATDVGLLLGAGVLWLKARRDLRAAVVGPVTVILTGLERIEAGDYSPVPPLTAGPAELRTISSRLAGVADRLENSAQNVRNREQEASEHAGRLRLIVKMGHEIAGSLNLRYVVQAVSDSVVGIGAFARCVIWLTDEGSGTLVPSHDSAGVKGRVAGLEPILVGEQAVGKAARFGRVLGPEEVSHPEVGEPWTHAIAVPMIIGARVVGVVEVGMNSGNDLPLPVMELLDTLSSQAATAIEAARLYEQADRRGNTDALTLLPNRHDLDRALAAEVSRAQRYDRPLTVAMIDIDHFKTVNDTLGHAHGDEILQETAAVMRAVLRDVDTIYRYGGEEFLVVMPETEADAAMDLCNRLRTTVSERLTMGGGVPLTVSGGVASFPADGGDPTRLVAAADKALYRAKAGGRDQVLAARNELPTVVVVEPQHSRIARVPPP